MTIPTNALRILAVCTLIFSTTIATASVSEVATWSSWSETSAHGTLGDISITASTTTDAHFSGFTGNHFAIFDGECGSWDGHMALSHDDQGVIANYVNAGDYQEFTFSSALTDGLFYVENFDSSSMAMLTATGATDITLVDQSDSISYSSTGDSSGKLSSSNASFNGEGDAVFLLSGDVTSVRLDFTAGEGNNGMIYTFAKGMMDDPSAVPPQGEPSAVPEPTSILVMGMLFGLGGLFAIRKRKA